MRAMDDTALAFELKWLKTKIKRLKTGLRMDLSYVIPANVKKAQKLLKNYQDRVKRIGKEQERLRVRHSQKRHK